MVYFADSLSAEMAPKGPESSFYFAEVVIIRTEYVAKFECLFYCLFEVVLGI